MTTLISDRPDISAGPRPVLSPREVPSPALLRLTLGTLAGVSGRVGQALRIASAFLCHSLASAHFVCGLDPRRFYEDYFGWRPVYRGLAPGFSVEIDDGRREARARLFAVAGHAVRFHEGYGTVSLHPELGAIAPPRDAPAPAP